MGGRGGRGGCDARADELFMREALSEARAAGAEGEVPIGAVVVHDGRVIARGRNRREADDDPSAHAEFSAMVEASRVLGRWRLTGCTVYVTLEPCLMCAGLMLNSRIDRCVFGASDPKGGALGTLFDVSSDERLNHAFAVESGVLETECAETISAFFRGLRGRGATDAGVRERSRVRGLPAAPRRRGAHGLVAADSFKGSASSEEVGEWLSEGIRRALPHARVASVPIADGGEGTLRALGASCGGELRTCEASGPFGARIAADYLMAEGDRGVFAVVEAARVCGLPSSPRTHAAALCAATRGVGELVLKAVAEGARTVYVGLGGTASIDGGAGMLQALGARISTVAGGEVPPGLDGLGAAGRIDLGPAREALRGVRLVALSDVISPLVGPRGAVRAFGAQKGLGAGFPQGGVADLFASLDGDMAAYGTMLTRARDALDGTRLQVGRDGARPKSLLGVPGSGAAGGCGAALLALGAELVSGIDAVLDLIGFDEAVRDALMVVTGEGSIDAQTAEGKAPVGVARRAKRVHPGIPVFAVCGSRARDLEAVHEAGIDAVLPILDGPLSLDAALDLSRTRENLVSTGETIGRIAGMGASMAGFGACRAHGKEIL